ncbi:MAG: hypothetical protein J7M32_04035 [Deltaproteobacteria bacterium]|nr:hypothetical protein [Deltaproteobacteria bacterium]
MTSKEWKPLKTAGVWTCIILAGLVAACISFFSIVSIWQGFTHMQQRGSWVPIVGGAFVLGLAGCLYVRWIRALHGIITSKELIDL